MTKFDFKKEYKEFYSSSAKEIQVVDVPEFMFLAADGYGDPAGSELLARLSEALYSLSYTVKFSLKKKGIDSDYAVPPLQGLWWMGNGDYFDADKRDEWKWTLMIAQPSFINTNMVNDAREQILKKKNLDTSHVRFENYKEGLSIQLLHIGPYSSEAENITRMHSFMKENGYSFNGKHHEIYLGDPRRTNPAKLKTILRQPVKK